MCCSSPSAPTAVPAPPRLHVDPPCALRSFTVALTFKQYSAVVSAYGSAEAPLTSLEACRTCKVEGSLLAERRKREKERILQVSRAPPGTRRLPCARTPPGVLAALRAAADAAATPSPSHSAPVHAPCASLSTPLYAQVDSCNIGPLDECMLMSEWWLAQWRQFIENGGATGACPLSWAHVVFASHRHW